MRTIVLALLCLQLGEQFGVIRTLTPTSDGELLVGTGKNFILSGKPEGPAEEFKVLVSGHSDELWGLATHPQRHQFLTACYDKTLVLWDALTHSAIWTKEINVCLHIHIRSFALHLHHHFDLSLALQIRVCGCGCASSDTYSYRSSYRSAPFRTRRTRRRSIRQAKWWQWARRRRVGWWSSSRRARRSPRIPTATSRSSVSSTRRVCICCP